MQIYILGWLLVGFIVMGGSLETLFVPVLPTLDVSKVLINCICDLLCFFLSCHHGQCLGLNLTEVK